MHLIDQHPAICAMGGYMIFNAFVAGMPAPDAKSGKAYRWAHTSLNVLAVNVGELARSRFPQTPSLSQGAQIDTATHITIPPADPGVLSNVGGAGEGKTPSL